MRFATRLFGLKTVALGAMALLAAPAFFAPALVGSALVGSAQAAVITQTLNFSVTDFQQIGNSPNAASYGTVTGTVVLTYDDATAVNITGQAVDSISFTDPTGVFETTDVLFDLRIPPNVNFPQHQWEFDIYGADAGQPVSISNLADWSLNVVGVIPLGADFSVIDGVGAQFLYTEGFSGSTVSFLSSSTSLTLTGTSVTAGGGTPVPAPAALMLLGLGLAGAGLMAKRRENRMMPATA